MYVRWMIRFAKKFNNSKIVTEMVPQKNYAVKSPEKLMNNGNHQFAVKRRYNCLLHCFQRPLPFSCHAVSDRPDSQSLTVKGEASGANFESGGAKPDPPGSLSRKKSAAVFRQVSPLPGRRGYEFYCQCQALDKKSPAAERQQGQLG